MSEVIKTDYDLCAGCNRCVRECPMEMPNITWQDDDGKIKVRIDHDKCITCGRCVTACRHDARYYEDDTAAFFADLSSGAPISLIAAPAIRTGMPEFRRLFTYLRQLGVRKIYDVSLGADICVWAHVRFMEKSGGLPIIAQPCPAVVQYCKIYKPALLKYLSPVHSPMGCVSAYMKEYEGIGDRIAALSPCIAKKDEFEDTGLADYNVTLSKLQAYIDENGIALPGEETGFDHAPGGIGSLFPMPGGFKENLEFYLGGNVSIDREEGAHIYERLDAYAAAPEELLPQVFDVLNCRDGCNMGTACAHADSANIKIFEINRIMDRSRASAKGGRDREYFDSIFRAYDSELDLSHFMREYKPVSTPFPQISEADIEKALEMLGKTDYEMQHVDCGACGSDTCRDMARKIALGINIPTNCMVRAMETAKAEHAQLLEMEKSREADDRMQILLDATPLCVHIWDKNFKVIDCNLETVKFFRMGSKQEYLERYPELSPEFQPDGGRSREKAVEYVKKAFDEGYHRFEWMRRMPDGALVPVEATLVRLSYKGEDFVAAYSRDLREQKLMLQDIYETTSKLDAVVSNYPGVVWSVDNSETVSLFQGRYLDVIGVTPSFLEGKSLDSARKKGRHPDIIEKVQQTIDEGPQDWISDIDGKKFRARTTPLFDESGQVSSVVGSIDDITEMIELQEKLKDQNISMLEQFEMVWDKVESGLVIIDCETREIIDANPAAALLYGDSRETMVGMLCYNLFGQHECPIMDMDQSMDRAERKLIKADGAVIPVLKSVSKIHFNGKPALLESFIDITHMKEAEAQKSMLEMGERMRTLLDANPHINILFDSSFRTIDCNPAAIRFMGFGTKEEMLEGFMARLAKSIPETLASGRKKRPMSEWFMEAVDNGVVRFETELVLGSETRAVNVEMKKIPYEDSFGIVAYVFDMTDVRKREMELTRSRELNELQLAKLNLAAQATKIGLWDMEIVSGDPVNPANAFIWSDEFRRLLGFSGESDFPNVFKSWIDRLHPEDKEEAIDAFARHLLDRTGNTPYYEEYRLLKKDGEYAYFRASGETIRDEDGNAIRVAGMLTDITETKNILLDTERQRIEAEAANKAKSAFLSTMSHEIRTPMNAILGVTEILLQNDSLDPGIRDALDKIYISGDMLLSIINDILDLSKIEAGKLELVFDNYEIASLVSDTAQLNMMRIGSKPIEFELFVDEGLPAIVRGDELRVKQILNNVLSNAFKYTAAGTVKLSVIQEEPGEEAVVGLGSGMSAEAEPETGVKPESGPETGVKAEAEAGAEPGLETGAETEPGPGVVKDGDTVTLVFRVSDTGQGMSKDQIDRLFDEFSRFNLEANRTTEGTGLGMSITQNLVSMMDGRIEIDSEPGKGTTFTVFLPQARAGSKTLGRESAENLHQFRTRSRAEMKRVSIAREPMPYGSVLIVDDVESNIYVARGLMAQYELKIDSADSGFEAIEKIKNGNVYDIVFMDHMMPKMDGIEATKILRGMGYNKPIVALTANAVSGQADIFLGNGLDDFIAKPIDVRQLNNILNKLIRDKYPPGIVEAARLQAKNRNGQPSPVLSGLGANPRFIESFLRDADRALAVLDSLNEKPCPFSEEEMRLFITYTHGMKSALANIGEMGISAIALKLEMAGRDEDSETIESVTPEFIDSLRALAGRLRSNKSDAADSASVGGTGGEAGRGSEATNEDLLYLKEALLEIKAACEVYDGEKVDDILEELRGKTWPGQTSALLDSISVNLLHSDFEDIAEAIAGFTS